jgi:hypothetical protein
MCCNENTVHVQKTSDTQLSSLMTDIHVAC